MDKLHLCKIAFSVLYRTTLIYRYFYKIYQANKITYFIISLFLGCESFAEKPQSTTNFVVWGNIGHAYQQGAVAFGLGREWWFSPVVSVEFSAKRGVASYSHKKLTENNLDAQIVSARINFEMASLSPRVNIPVGNETGNYIFAGVPLNAYFLQTTGNMRYGSATRYTAKNNMGPLFSSGLEVGFSGCIFEGINVRAYLGGSYLNFRKSIEKLDFVAKGAPENFSAQIRGTKFGITFCF